MKESNIIGMDLGDKKHVVCVLGAAGAVVEQTTVAATPEAAAAGLEALVGNARKLRAIWANEHKSDVRDAEMLARIARLDRQLLYPIHHRDEATQARLVLIQARDGLVGARTISSARSGRRATCARMASASPNAVGRTPRNGQSWTSPANSRCCYMLY
ncbi:MAG: hypothetical protein NTY53_14750 [Kiritimatiellaeota bacterium]|nr:hypothetical protein [Kiritimatiellota bacterium]